MVKFSRDNLKCHGKIDTRNPSCSNREGMEEHIFQKNLFKNGIVKHKNHNKKYCSVTLITTFKILRFSYISHSMGKISFLKIKK